VHSGSWGEGERTARPEAPKTTSPPYPSPWERGADAMVRVPTHQHASPRHRAGIGGTGRELNRMQEKGRRAQTDSPPRRQGRQETVARMKCLVPRLEPSQEAWWWGSRSVSRGGGDELHPLPLSVGEGERTTRPEAPRRSGARCETARQTDRFERARHRLREKTAKTARQDQGPAAGVRGFATARRGHPALYQHRTGAPV